MYELVHSPTFICTIFCEYPLGEVPVNQQKKYSHLGIIFFQIYSDGDPRKWKNRYLR